MTGMRAQVPMSKLTWLSKNKLAQSPAKEMGGEFVLAGPRKLSDPVHGSVF